jgi:hypothetical protein
MGIKKKSGDFLVEGANEASEAGCWGILCFSGKAFGRSGEPTLRQLLCLGRAFCGAEVLPSSTACAKYQTSSQ